MTSMELIITRNLVTSIAAVLLKATVGNASVKLKDSKQPFVYSRLVSYLFDDFDIEFYVEPLPLDCAPEEETIFRFVSTATLPDGGRYDILHASKVFLPNPIDAFRLMNGDTDKLIQLLKDAT